MTAHGTPSKEFPSVIYLSTKIVEIKRKEARPGAGMTRAGYTCNRGAPSSWMIRLEGEKIWRRLMVWQFSNAGTLFVRIAGIPHIVPEHALPADHNRA